MNPKTSDQNTKKLESSILMMVEDMFHFDPVRLASFKYRDRVTIFRDVLKTIKRPDKSGRKYVIMKHAALSYNQLNKYLLFLTNMGYVKEIAEQTGKKYEVTEKGSMFLKSLEDLRLHIHK